VAGSPSPGESPSPRDGPRPCPRRTPPPARQPVPRCPRRPQGPPRDARRPSGSPGRRTVPAAPIARPPARPARPLDRLRLQLRLQLRPRVQQPHFPQPVLHERRAEAGRSATPRPTAERAATPCAVGRAPEAASPRGSTGCGSRATAWTAESAESACRAGSSYTADPARPPTIPVENPGLWKTPLPHTSEPLPPSGRPQPPAVPPPGGPRPSPQAAAEPKPLAGHTLRRPRRAEVARRSALPVHFTRDPVCRVDFARPATGGKAEAGNGSEPPPTRCECRSVHRA